MDAARRSLTATDAGSTGEQVHLVVQSGRHSGAALTVALPLRRPLSVGSHLTCDLVLTDEGVAPLHGLCFERQGHLWFVAARVGDEVGAAGADDAPGEPTPLVDGTTLRLGAVEVAVHGGPAVAPRVAPARAVAAPRRPRSLGRFLASLALLAAGGGLLLLSLLPTAQPLAAGVAAGARAGAPAGSAGREPAASDAARQHAEAAARHIERYLSDPAVKVVVQGASRIVLSGSVVSPLVREQIDKLKRALPAGLEIVDSVSYGNSVPVEAQAQSALPLSALGPRILQVAASERAPYIEIEDGQRVFEGGQFNGYELLKIAPGEIVARRNQRIQSFTVE